LDTFSECRVLHDVARGAIEINLLSIRPRVFINRPIPQLTGNRPLIRFLDSYFCGFTKWPAGPGGCNTIQHLRGHFSLLFAGVGINDSPGAASCSASTAATKPVDGPSIKRVQPHLTWNCLQAGFLGSLLR